MSDPKLRHCLILDEELNFLIRDKAQQQGISISEVMRDALRWYFNLPVTTFDNGWHAGFREAVGTVLQAVHDTADRLKQEHQAAALPPIILPPKSDGSY